MKIMGAVYIAPLIFFAIFSIHIIEEYVVAQR